MNKPGQRFPRGWDEKRVKRVLEYYESQTEEEAIAEDEAAFAATTRTVIKVPFALVPQVRKLIAQRERSRARRRSA